VFKSDRRPVRDLRDDLVGPVLELVGRKDVIDESEVASAVAVDDPAGHRQFHGESATDEPGRTYEMPQSMLRPKRTCEKPILVRSLASGTSHAMANPAASPMAGPSIFPMTGSGCVMISRTSLCSWR